jgi:hypothetical protein
MHWDRLYQERTARLAKFLSRKDPAPIIENECWLVIHASARTHSVTGLFIRWAKHEIKSWFQLKAFQARWKWKRIRGWSEEECEVHFWGTPNDEFE